MTWICVLFTAPAAGQRFSDIVTQNLAFEKPSPENTIIVANINGSVSVSGHAGEEIRLESDRAISGKTQPRVDRGKAEISLGIIDRGDTIIVYVKEGCHQFRRQTQKHGLLEYGWGYDAHTTTPCRLDYDYRVDIDVVVPSGTNVLVSTINDGDVTVRGVRGVVRAGNINGGIRLTSLEKLAEARTINGDVEIEYIKNPDGDCVFYSLNGDIHASFQPGLSADMSFESFNGGLYSNMPKIERLPHRLTQTTREDGLRYKIGGDEFRVGDGGALLAFETFNGDVFVKEIKDK